MSNSIIIEHLSKSYGHIAAVDDLSLEIPRGTSLVLLGRNGSGKTTLLSALTGFLYPDTGRISIFGLDPYRDAAKVRLTTAFISAANALPTGFSPREIGSVIKDFFPKYDEKLAETTMKLFRFDPDRPIGKQSFGQIRLINLWAALIRRPELLILAEPMLGLDVVVRRDFTECVINLLEQNDCTLILSSHLINEVENLVEQVAIIDAGKLILQGSTETLRTNTGTSLEDIFISAVEARP